ncbi:MAG: hypothetical protein ABSC63_13625 [Candidatus Binataceae bacterium]|jgi:hypothetical protein
MACIELSIDDQAELIQIITQSVVASAGDKERAAELFAESMEAKGIGWLISMVFGGVVKDVKPWHSGYNIEFAPAFTTQHRDRESAD